MKIDRWEVKVVADRKFLVFNLARMHEALVLDLDRLLWRRWGSLEYL